MENANLSLVRRINYRLVWNQLIESKESTIVNLEKQTGLSFPTINRAIEYGKNIGFIIDGKIEDSSIGRRAQMYKVNPDYYHLLTIIANDNDLIYRIYNANNIIIKESKIPFSYDRFIENIDKLLEKLLIEDILIQVVSISFAGVVNDGIIMDCLQNQELCGFNAKEYLENKYGILAEICNNVKTLAHYVNFKYKRDKKNNFAIVDCGYNGYACSIVANGEVLYGKNSFAGEICYLEDVPKINFSSDDYKKFILPIITVCAPYKIFLYTPLGDDFIDSFMNYVTESVQTYAMPNIIVCDNIENDMFSGLYDIANVKKLEIMIK